MKKIISIIILSILIITSIVGCSGDTSTKGKGEIAFAGTSWDSTRVHNAIVGLIAKKVYGYSSWREISGSTPIMHEGMINGEIDVHMECWSDNIASYESDLSQGKFKELGINFDDNFQGFYVPKYVIEGDESRGIEALAPDLKYVWDLKKYPEVFPDDESKDMGRIYGALPGWEADPIMHGKFLHYGLDESFVYFRPGSDPALSAALSDAYERGEPVVGYYWEPTWLMGKYDFILLEDEPFDEATYLEGKTALPAVRVTVGVSNKFAESAEEEFLEFLGNYRTSSALTSEALAYMQDTGADYKETAEWFLKNHDDLINEWLNPDEAQIIRDYLN